MDEPRPLINKGRARAMRGRTAIGLLAAYYCIAMLTGTHWYQHHRDSTRAAEGIPAVLAGIAWPLYWSARAAMKVTE